MSGKELIEWLKDECLFLKIPPTDSAMIAVLRSLHDVDSAFRTIRHEKAEKEG